MKHFDDLKLFLKRVASRVQRFTKLQRFKHRTTGSRKTAFGLVNNLEKRNIPETANKGSGSNKGKNNEKQNCADKFI